MSKSQIPFQRSEPRKIDPAEVEAFGAKADAPEAIAPAPAPVKAAPVSVPEVVEKQTESVLFRLTKTQAEEIQFVFENTNVKSKQKLLEAIILPEIQRRAMELRK